MLDVRVLTPVDLAVSKLSRFSDHDRADIATLTRRGLLEYEQYGAPFRWLLPAPHRRRYLRAAFAAAH